MSDDPRSTLPSRRAALLLQGVGAADRAWLLARLEPRERDSVQPLLAELGSLGLAAGRDTVERWCQPDPEKPTPAGAGRATETREPQGAIPVAPPCDGASAPQSDPTSERAPWRDAWRLVRTLRREPDAIALAVLRTRPRWMQSMALIGCGRVRRGHLREGLRSASSALPPGLARALEAALRS